MPTRQEEIEKLAELALGALVEVAWADGAVTPAERDSVFKAARALGLDQRAEFCRSTLKRWLFEPPPAEALDGWRRDLAPLLEKSTSRPAVKIKSRLLGEARKIAKMDVRPFDDGESVDPETGITNEERRVLDAIEAVLENLARMD